MRVSYDKDQRAKARREGKRLYTYQITGPGGGGSITVQGFFTPETLSEIGKLTTVMFANNKKEDKKKEQK